MILPIDTDAIFATSLVLLAGVFMAGTAIHAFAARHRKQRWDHGSLAVVCLSAATYLVMESILYTSHDLATHALVRRLEEFAVAPFSLFFPLYQAGLAGISKRAVACVSITATMAVLAVTLHSSSGLWLQHIDRLESFRLPWGETLMMAKGPASRWMYLSLCTWLSICVFGIWSALRYRRDPAAIGVVPLILANSFFFVALIHDSLLDANLIHGIFLSELVAPVMTGAMWWRVAIGHRRQVESWQQLFTRTGDALFVHDVTTGKLVEVNEAACSVLSRTRPELLIGGMAMVLVNQDDVSSLFSAAAPTSNRGSTLIERACRRGDGGVFPAEIALRRTTLAGREQIVASLRDLTRRREAEMAVIENERRLRQVIERCPLPVVETDATGRTLSLNPGFSDIFGHPTSHLDPYEGWGQLAQPDATERQTTLDSWRRAVAIARDNGGVLPSFRVPMRDKHGQTRQVDVSSVEVGERMVLFITDLTEILVARDTLAEQEALQRAIIEEASDGVAVIAWKSNTYEPSVRLWNRRMAELFGRTMEGINAQGWDLQMPGAGASREASFQPLLRILHGGEPLTDHEFAFSPREGQRRFFLISTSRLTSPPNEPLTLMIVRDISAQRLNEQQRRHLEAQAQKTQQLESLGVLAGGIAHDFNNLLMAILGRAGLVRASLAASDHLSWDDLIEMEDAARRAAGLCQQLLAYAGKGGSHVGALNLSALVRDMEAMLSVSVSKNVALDLTLCESVTINADAGQVRQVIMNLVVNASEAIGDRSGSILVRVGQGTVDAPRDSAAGPLSPGQYAILEVIDSGSGMEASTLLRVYEPFFSTKFTGRGLGLAVALGIVRSHRGAIEITSVPGKGTAVNVLFPATEIEAKTTERIRVPTKRPTAVLIVDDEPSIRSITCEMLLHLGHTVLEAASAQEAIMHYTNGQRPHTVILDLSLPDATGGEVLGRIREIDASARVIVTSGYGQEDIRRFLGKYIPDGILTKPYDLTALTAVLRTGDAMEGVRP